MNISPHYIKAVSVVKILFNHLVGQLSDSNIILSGAVDHLVINICEVLHVSYFIALIFEITA